MDNVSIRKQVAEYCAQLLTQVPFVTPEAKMMAAQIQAELLRALATDGPAPAPMNRQERRAQERQEAKKEQA